jgi:hypothetical protein
MIETLLSDAMHSATDDLEYSSALFDAAARQHERRRFIRLSIGSAGALAAIALAAVIAVPGASGANQSAVRAHGSTLPAHSVAYVARMVKASLADQNDYVITSHITSPESGLVETSWLDPSSASRVLQLDNADGTHNTVEGVVVKNGQAQITSLDYATHTVSTVTEPVTVIEASPRLGVNVASPSQIQTQITGSDLVDRGATTLAGQNVEQYQLMSPWPTGSEIWAHGTEVELYVNAATYQLAGITVGGDGGLVYSEDLTWTPRTALSLATTKLAIPSGFTID